MPISKTSGLHFYSWGSNVGEVFNRKDRNRDQADNHDQKTATRAGNRFGDEVIRRRHRSTSVRLGGLHLHRHPVSEVQKIGCGHLLIQFQALGDGVQVVLQFAHSDWSLQGKLHV